MLSHAYPIPDIQDTLDNLRGVEYFATFDLLSGYWQLGMTERAKERSLYTTWTFSVHSHAFRFVRCSKFLLSFDVQCLARTVGDMLVPLKILHASLQRVAFAKPLERQVEYVNRQKVCAYPQILT